MRHACLLALSLGLILAAPVAAHEGAIVVPQGLTPYMGQCVPLPGKSACSLAVGILDNASGRHVFLTAARTKGSAGGPLALTAAVPYPPIRRAFEAMMTCSLSGKADPMIVALALIDQEREFATYVAHAWRVTPAGQLLRLNASQVRCKNETFGLDVD